MSSAKSLINIYVFHICLLLRCWFVVVDNVVQEINVQNILLYLYHHILGFEIDHYK